MVAVGPHAGIIDIPPLNWTHNRDYFVFSQFSSKSLFGTAQANLDYRLVFVVSCLLSMWLITIDPLINRDAIIYLRTADAYLQDGILASQSLYDRPWLCIHFWGIKNF